MGMKKKSAPEVNNLVPCQFLSVIFVKTDASGFNGIKVEISDLGIEIEINKNALKKSIIAHVLNTSKIF